MSKGIHRTAGNTKRGRQIAAQTSRILQGPGLTAEQKAWNARVERERNEKKAKR